MGDGELSAGAGEAVGVEARPVIGEHAARGDAEALEVSHGFGEEAGRRVGLLVGIERGVGDARVVVDRDVEELPTGSASLILRIAGDAMASLDDTGELLDVEVQHIARRGVLVAHDGDRRLQHLRLVQLQAGQDAADRGPAQAGGLRDAHPGPTLPAEPLHRFDQFL